MTTPTRRPALIVDDDRATRLLLAGELHAAGYRPVEAASGADAVSALAAERFRIVLTDWLMPDIDGLQLCRRIRADPGLRATYVMMITVNSDKPRLISAFEAGVDDFLPKPIEPGILMARLRAAARTVDLQDAILLRNAELESGNRRLLTLATTDELTALPNRRQGLTRLEDRWAQSAPLSVALVDVDHFKHLNDTYGHSVGDRVLAEVAAVLSGACRRQESICRFGGEEFLCVLPGTTEHAAAAVGERLRAAVAAHRIAEGTLTLSATVSIGVATRLPYHRNTLDLIRCADHALYAAKECGRNAVRNAA